MTEFHVVLPNLNYRASELLFPSGDNDGDVENKDVGTLVNSQRIPIRSGKNAKVIVRAMTVDSHITIAELCRKTHLSASGVYKIIDALKKAAVIRRVGPTKKGRWEVIKDEE
jgi:predicted HTH transcriptional regulator